MKYEILKKYFGYDIFRRGQEELIDSILEGRDVLGIMPTGAGKSLCYQVPALMLSGITLVISPLISLMKDQVQSLNQAGIHAAYINSSLTESQIARALQYAAEGRYQIIYVAPERLETPEFIEFACKTRISMVTVDEAHCISQWGQDFRPSYLKIVRFIQALAHRPVISAFTATATQAVRDDILCVLNLNNPQISMTGFDRENLYFGVETPKKKNEFLLHYLTNHEGESGIIYCATRKNVEAVYELLLRSGVPVTRYHAGLSNEERKKNQDDFIYDATPIMVATNAFGMGINKSNVRFVVHYNMPQSLENYYQEAGRAGRDGEAAECILLYSPQDVMISRFLLENKLEHTESKEDGPVWDEAADTIREQDEERLKAMIWYCTGTKCLRESILRYFGEPGIGACGRCSNCQKEYEEEDVTGAAIKIIRCIRDSRQRYGVNVISGILCGSSSAKLREYGVINLPSYGSLREWTEAKVKQVINQMLADHILNLTKDKYMVVKLERTALEIEQGRQELVVKFAKRTQEQERWESGGDKAVLTKYRKSDILTSAGLDLFEQLRELRTGIAREEALPPYIIFSDKTLVDMCIKLPGSRSEMLQVSGVGEHKYEKYGAKFLRRISESTTGKHEKFFFGDREDVMGITGTKEAVKKATISSVPKKEFYITDEMKQKITYTNLCLLTDFANRLNDVRNTEEMKKTSGAAIFRMLTESQYTYEKYTDGMWKKYVTQKGIEAGITVGLRVSAKGREYEDLYYNENAQKMIVEML